MNLFKHFSIVTSVILLGFVVFTSCQKTKSIIGDEILNPEKQFDMNLFQANVEAGLGNQWAGYAYVINHNGHYNRSGSFGNRRAGNDGNLASDIDAALYGASLNKVMTATAMLRVLQEKGNGNAAFWLNANVFQFLPPNWSFGPNTTSITFRDLLEHRSGIASNAGIDYSDLRTLIATGTSNVKTYSYSNANYALLRILIARMSGNANVNNVNDDVAAASATLSGFKRYMDNEILAPLEITMDTRPEGNSPTLYYQWGNMNNGWLMGDMSDRLGNGGYYFSPVQFAKFIAFLNHSELIISNQTRELMYDQFLGWGDEILPVNETTGQQGRYYYKGGSFCNSSQNGNCNGQGVRNIVVTYPKNNVEIVIMGNSRGGNMDTGSGLRAMLRNAYDNAWVK